MPKEGLYCRECNLYSDDENGCSPFENTRNDAGRLTKEYREKYFRLTECPYFGKK